MSKNLLLHYEFMKNRLTFKAETLQQLCAAMHKVFGVDYFYVRREVHELILLKKIKKVKYNDVELLQWTEKVMQFEHDLTNNVIQLDRQYIEFMSQPSKVRQMRFPLHILKELVNKLPDLGEGFELILEMKAIKSNKVWYKIQRSM